MDKKERRKIFRRFVARVGIKICSLTMKYMPLGLLYFLAKVFSPLVYFFAVRLRKIAYENLKLAFGDEKNILQIKKIVKANFSYITQGSLELIKLIENPRILDERVRILGKENLQKANGAGCGTIVVSAHFGNFPLMVTKLALEGLKINLVVRKLRDEKVDKMLLEKRKCLGINSIYNQPRNICVESCIEHLRRNEVIILQIDQNFGSGAGVFVDFFGRKAATPTGPVVLALRTKAKIIPVFIVRKSNNYHTVFVEKEFALEEKDSLEETVQFNITKLTKIIEGYIRRYPEEWSWIHRRWKTQPRKVE